jgi:hypothetical protein
MAENNNTVFVVTKQSFFHYGTNVTLVGVFTTLERAKHAIGEDEDANYKIFECDTEQGFETVFNIDKKEYPYDTCDLIAHYEE